MVLNANLGKFCRVFHLKMLVYFGTIWSILRPLVYFMVIWDIFPVLGMEKSGNPDAYGKFLPLDKIGISSVGA
jgi:hypothetical protein